MCRYTLRLFPKGWSPDRFVFQTSLVAWMTQPSVLISADRNDMESIFSAATYPVKMPHESAEPVGAFRGV